MEVEFLQMIIVNLPNFFFAFVLFVALMRIIDQQYKRIDKLLDMYERCEDDNDKQKLLAK